jgi:hypothetical protein
MFLAKSPFSNDIGQFVLQFGVVVANFRSSDIAGDFGAGFSGMKILVSNIVCSGYLKLPAPLVSRNAT